MNKQLFFPILLLSSLLVQTTQAGFFTEFFSRPDTAALQAAEEAARVAAEKLAAEVAQKAAEEAARVAAEKLAAEAAEKAAKGFVARTKDSVLSLAGTAKDKLVSASSIAASYVMDHSKAFTVGTIGLIAAVGAYKAYNHFVKAEDSKTRKALKGTGIVAVAALPVAGSFYGFDTLSSCASKAVNFVAPYASKVTDAVTSFVSSNPKLTAGLVLGAAVLGYLGRKGLNRYRASNLDMSPEAVEIRRLQAKADGLFQDWVKQPAGVRKDDLHRLYQQASSAVVVANVAYDAKKAKAVVA